MNKHYYCIANWKMYFSWHQACSWITTYAPELALLSQQTNLIICPSFEALNAVAVQKKGLLLGAQDCSSHSLGAFTGQVCAQSLHELGVTYCLIGHSEVRKACHLVADALYNKLVQCLEHRITPIFCIGEAVRNGDDKQLRETLQRDLEPVHKVRLRYSEHRILIAYEPLWAIGTGIIAPAEYITKALAYIKEMTDPWPTALLYGGTVNAGTIETLKEIPLLDGVLVGKASTDFQELKKIVSWLVY